MINLKFGALSHTSKNAPRHVPMNTTTFPGVNVLHDFEVLLLNKSDSKINYKFPTFKCNCHLMIKAKHKSSSDVKVTSTKVQEIKGQV